MADTYVFIIREEDWDSDQYLGMSPSDADSAESMFPAHAAFAVAVEKLGAKITGGNALQNRKHGGSVTPGQGDRAVQDAVYTDAAYAAWSCTALTPMAGRDHVATVQCTLTDAQPGSIPLGIDIGYAGTGQVDATLTVGSPDSDTTDADNEASVVLPSKNGK